MHFHQKNAYDIAGRCLFFAFEKLAVGQTIADADLIEREFAPRSADVMYGQKGQVTWVSS